MWGDTTVWVNHIVWGDTLLGIVDGTDVVWGEHIVWGDSADPNHVVWGRSDEGQPDEDLVDPRQRRRGPRQLVGRTRMPVNPALPLEPELPVEPEVPVGPDGCRSCPTYRSSTDAGEAAKKRFEPVRNR